MDGQADLCFLCAHMSEGTFSHVVAHIFIALDKWEYQIISLLFLHKNICCGFLLTFTTVNWLISDIFLFSQKTGFDISCKLSPLETICMKSQILFSRKNKKKIFQYTVC